MSNSPTLATVLKGPWSFGKAAKRSLGGELNMNDEKEMRMTPQLYDRSDNAMFAVEWLGTTGGVAHRLASFRGLGDLFYAYRRVNSVIEGWHSILIEKPHLYGMDGPCPDFESFLKIARQYLNHGPDQTHYLTYERKVRPSIKPTPSE